MIYKEWLAGLKVGDEVYVSGSYGSGRIARVAHTTRTLVVVGVSKFRRRDGAAIGDGHWVRSCIHPITQEHRDKLERLQLISRIEGSLKDHKNITLDTLRAVAKELMKPTTGEGGGA